jgi:hypothetical protein
MDDRARRKADVRRFDTQRDEAPEPADDSRRSRPENHPYHAGVPGIDPLEGRHAMRRLAESANRLSRADRLLVLDCQGRGCRRRLGQVLTRPRGGAVTPHGTIEPDHFTDGPVLAIFGPFDQTSRGVPGEYRLRGRTESVTAPTQSITLRGHRMRDDGTFDPEEVPLGPGQQIVIVCGCGHRNQVNMSALSATVEPARAAIDGA